MNKCISNIFSSCCCELGTKGCEVKHGPTLSNEQLWAIARKSFMSISDGLPCPDTGEDLRRFVAAVNEASRPSKELTEEEAKCLMEKTYLKIVKEVKENPWKSISDEPEEGQQILCYGDKDCGIGIVYYCAEDDDWIKYWMPVPAMLGEENAD